MPLDPRARRFLNVLAAGKPPSILESTVAERRLGHAELMKFAGPMPPLAALEVRQMPGPGGDLGLRIYSPAGPAAIDPAAPAALPGLIYFHGGGLISGSAQSHDAVAAALANAGGCRVVSVDYRLAPEHPFPAAVEDALAAVTFVAVHAADFGIDPGRLGIGGDSAGATLAAVTSERLARGGAEPLPAKLAVQLLICPLLDHLSTSVSRDELAYGYLVDRDTFAHDLKHYLPPGTDPGDPRISPLRAADFSGLPPTLVHTAECDPLRDEGREYAGRLSAAGTAADYTCHPGMIHLFYGLGAVIPYARTAFELIGAQLRDAFAGRGVAGAGRGAGAGMISPERDEARRLVGELHGARVAGDLVRLCRLFAPDGLFEIAGASADKPIAISALGLAQFRPWLLMMVKVFRLSDYRLLSLVVEAPKAVAHWRVDIHSKVTGVTVPTELVDLIEIRDGLIINYSEFFVPRPGSGPVPRRFREP